VTGDVGDTIEVVVTATNDGGSVAATSLQTATVLPPAPVITTLPLITGTAQQGVTLTADDGSWDYTPTGYSYQWQDCSAGRCTDISGATGSTYAVQATDVGDTIEGHRLRSSAGLACLMFVVECSPSFGSGLPIQAPAGHVVDQRDGLIEFGLCYLGEVCALRKETPQVTVDVFV
jgi:hypothetical protein